MVLTEYDHSVGQIEALSDCWGIKERHPVKAIIGSHDQVSWKTGMGAKGK